VRRLAAPGRRNEVAEERLRREVGDLPPGGLEHGHVGADEQHPLLLAVLGREPLEQRVGVRRTKLASASTSSRRSENGPP
jgi:hypothetical protein